MRALLSIGVLGYYVHILSVERYRSSLPPIYKLKDSGVDGVAGTGLKCGKTELLGRKRIQKSEEQSWGWDPDKFGEIREFRTVEDSKVRGAGSVVKIGGEYLLPTGEDIGGAKSYKRRRCNVKIGKEGMKRCATCEDIKLKGEFGMVRKAWDGLSWSCKDCVNKRKTIVTVTKVRGEDITATPIADSLGDKKLKTCTACERTLELEYFSKKAKAKDGLDWRCRACKAEGATRSRESVVLRTKILGKVCSKCQKHKDSHEFNVNKTDRTGLQSYCKTCANAASAKYAKRNELRRKAKTCAKCKESMERSMFNNSKKAKDGKQGWCRACHSQAIKESRDRKKGIRECTSCGKDKTVASFGGIMKKECIDCELGKEARRFAGF